MKALDLLLIDPKAVWAALFSNALIKCDYRISWKKKYSWMSLPCRDVPVFLSARL